MKKILLIIVLIITNRIVFGQGLNGKVLVMPVWSTATRPSGGQLFNGVHGCNSDSSGQEEFYYGGAWHGLAYTAGAGGFSNPMSAAGQMIFGGTGGTATSTSTPAHAGMRPVWDGSVVKFTDTTAGGIGGSTTQVQFNNSGAFGGSANFVWDNTNNILTVQNALAANTAADGIILQNTTAAAAGNQRFSPNLTLLGNGWATTGSVSKSVSFTFHTVPVQGTTSPTGDLLIQGLINGSGNTIMQLNTAGYALINGATQYNSANLAVNGKFAASSDGYFGSTGSTSGLRVFASGNNMDLYNQNTAGATIILTGSFPRTALFAAPSNNVMIGNLAADESTAALQVSLTPSGPTSQLALHFDATHHADFTVGSTSILGISSINGLTINTGALPTGATTDSALVVTNSAGTSTFKAVAISDIANSGTYTPTITNGTNIAGSTTATCYWQRVGNIVTVSGSILFSLTSASVASQVDFSLPVASNFTGSGDAAGLMAGGNMLGTVPIAASAANDRITVLFTGSSVTTSQTNSFNFSYIVQ